MAEQNGLNADLEEQGSVEEVISCWRRHFTRLSPDKILFILEREIDAFKKCPIESKKPKEFAMWLLCAYKIAGVLTADKNGYIPFEISHCFAYRDIEQIVDNDPSLIPRLFLCTAQDHDFVEDDKGIVLQILSELKDFAAVKSHKRKSLHVQTKHNRRNPTRGPLRVGPHKRTSPDTDTEAEAGLYYHYWRFHCIR